MYSHSLKKMSDSEDSLAARLDIIEMPEHGPIYVPVPVRVYHCDECTEWFNTQTELDLHKHEHTLKCSKCGLKFKSVQETERHDPFCQRRFGIQIVPRPQNPRPEPPRPDPPRPKKFRCRKCRRKFPLKNQRNIHEVSCEGLRWVRKK